MAGWAEQPPPAQAGLDLPSLQLKAVIAMETDGANMNEAQEGLVFFFLVKYIFYLSLHTKKYYECLFNHLETSAPFRLFMV